MKRSGWILALVATGLLFATALPALALPAPSSGVRDLLSDDSSGSGGGDGEDEFEGVVASVDADTGTFALEDGTAVHVTEETAIDASGDLVSLGAVEDGLAQGLEVEAEGYAVPRPGGAGELDALEVRFEIDEDDDRAEFEDDVVAASATGGTFTLESGVVVHVTGETVIDPEGDLQTLRAVEDAVADDRDVRAQGDARPLATSPNELEALTVEFEVDDDEDDVDDDEEFDDDFGDEERELKVDIEDQEVTIKLESKAAGREDEVKVQFNAAEGEMKVSFEREDNGEEEVEMRVTFRSLDEILADEDAAFGFTVVQRFPLANLTLVSLDEEDFTADNGATGKQIAATYALPGTEDGTFGLVFWVFGEFAFVNGVPVRPTEVKIDIHILGFPFEDEASSVAVNLAVKTEFEVEMEDVPTLEEIAARGEEFTAFFRWASSASVDGTDRPVTSVTLRESQEVEREGDEAAFEKKVHLLLVYPQGAEIVHDPTVGVERIVTRALASGPSALAFALGLATASTLVLGAWMAGRRRY